MTASTSACERAEDVQAYALGSLPREEAAAVERHVATCSACRAALETLRKVVDTFASWPTDVLRPAASVWDRLAERVGISAPASAENGHGGARWVEPEWENVAPGIWCKLLATDTERERVSMLVRLEPGGSYPPHTHAGVEELHLLDGELWINDRKLYPGDYNLGKPGGSDWRVYSETGCTCVLVTSPLDVLS